MRRQPRLNRNEVCYLLSMKKLICLFLMLWLPISASSAWAMSTQMQLGENFDAPAETMVDMPCHDMATHDSPASEQEPGLKHNCTACGACFTILATGTPSVTYFSSTIVTSRAAPPANDQTISLTYPPALRPPIAS